MAVTISRPKIGKRPDILDNGKQRINPETGKLVWIPEICVTMSTDNVAADEEVCVTIYHLERRPKRGSRPRKLCTKKAILPKKIVRPGGSMTTLIKVCCDLVRHDATWVPEKGAEFRAAWQLKGAGPCPDAVPLKRGKRSKKLTVDKPLKLCMYSGGKIEHAAILGIGAPELEEPHIAVAAALPLGWTLDVSEDIPESFPAAIPLTITSRPGAFLDEEAEVSLALMDVDGFKADEVTYRFGIAPDPAAPECLEPPEDVEDT